MDTDNAPTGLETRTHTGERRTDKRRHRQRDTQTGVKERENVSVYAAEMNGDGRESVREMRKTEYRARVCTLTCPGCLSLRRQSVSLGPEPAAGHRQREEWRSLSAARALFCSCFVNAAEDDSSKMIRV